MSSECPQPDLKPTQAAACSIACAARPVWSAASCATATARGNSAPTTTWHPPRRTRSRTSMSRPMIGNLYMTLPGRDRAAPGTILEIAPRQRAPGRQLRRRRRRGCRPLRIVGAARGAHADRPRHHGDGHPRRGVRVVRRGISRQRRRIRAARPGLPVGVPLGQRPHPRGHPDRARLRSRRRFAGAAGCSTPRGSRHISSCTSSRGPGWWPRACRRRW